jgi:hypothetical protein
MGARFTGPHPSLDDLRRCGCVHGSQARPEGEPGTPDVNIRDANTHIVRPTAAFQTQVRRSAEP